MADIRQSYAATRYANLDPSELVERPVDRVGAAGRSDELGILCHKVKIGLVPEAYRALQRAALAVFCERYKNESLERATAIVAQAMSEYIAPMCRTCQGRRHMMVGELKVGCPDCHASGTRRHSDESRARQMGYSYAMAKHSARKIDWLVGRLHDAERAANWQMSDQLERA